MGMGKRILVEENGVLVKRICYTGIMNRFLAYAIAFGNIMAILTVTVIQPQSAALWKKKQKPKDIRQYLLAQTCPQYQYTDPGAPCYMYMPQPPAEGCSSADNYATCPSFCPNHPSEQSCPAYMEYTMWMTCYASGGTYTPGAGCTPPQQGSQPNPPPMTWPPSSGGSGSGETVYYAGDERQRNIIQEGCITELKYAEPKKGDEKRALSQLGAQLEREGTPDTIIEDVKNICFGLPSLTAGKMGNDAFQNGTAEKALKEAADYSLNNALQPRPGESVQDLTKRALHEYLVRIKKEAFDPLQKIKDTNAYLIDPMKHIGTVLPKIKEIIASYQPKEEVAVEKPKEEEAVVPAPAVPVEPVAIAPRPTPAKPEAKPQENVVQRILNVLKRALGITREDREKGLRQNKIRSSSPEQIWARRDRTRAIRDTFQKKRAEYCTTHSC